MMRSQTFLRIIFLMVFIGWLIVWILLPTKTYKNKWTPKLKSKLNSTYFREQGTNLLLLTFPVIFIGALSCIYLHLHQKRTEKSSSTSGGVSNGRLRVLRRPYVVISEIGIVTGMELIFAVMFGAMLIWSLYNYLHISFGHLHMHKQTEKVWQAKLRSVSLRLGYIGNICWAFLFFPVTRGSSILPLVGLTSESSIKYHIFLGHLSMLLFAAHTIGFFIYWAITDQMKEHLVCRKLTSVVSNSTVNCHHYHHYSPSSISSTPPPSTPDTPTTPPSSSTSSAASPPPPPSSFPTSLHHGYLPRVATTPPSSFLLCVEFATAAMDVQHLLSVDITDIARNGTGFSVVLDSFKFWGYNCFVCLPLSYFYH